MKKLCLFLLVFLLLGGSSCEKSQEGKITRMEEKIEIKSQAPGIGEDKESTLKIVPISANTIGIDLTNNVPVKGVQFTIKGIKVTEVRITSRTKGFLAKFNEENGRVILVTFSEKMIAPGTGPVIEITHDNGGSASLAEIKIAKQLTKQGGTK